MFDEIEAEGATIVGVFIAGELIVVWGSIHIVLFEVVLIIGVLAIGWGTDVSIFKDEVDAVIGEIETVFWMLGIADWMVGMGGWTLIYIEVGAF